MNASADSASTATRPPLPSLATQLDGPLGTFLQHRILPGWLPTRRWFRSKTHPVRSVALEAVFACGQDAVFAVARVTFVEESDERYALPLALAEVADEANLPEAAVLGPVATPAGLRLLIDGCWSQGFRDELYRLLAHPHETSGVGGTLRGHPVSDAAPGAGSVDSGNETTMTESSPRRTKTSTTNHNDFAPASRVLSAEQSNTSLVYGGEDADALFVKLYRRLEEGVNPEPEMLRFLSERTNFRHAPAFRSSLEWVTTTGHACTAALAQEFLPGAADAWSHVLGGLRASAGRSGGAEESLASLRALAALMGRRVAELHVAAASSPLLPAFAPEPFTVADAEAARRRARASLAAGARAAAHAELTANLPRLEALLDTAVNAVDGGETGLKIRAHGDLHLGQILVITGERGPDLRILDFEGEPGRPLAAARVKQSPLRDVAGMLRSFHYAAHATLLLDTTENVTRETSRHAGAAFDPDKSAAALCAAFLEAYWTTIEGATVDGGAAEAEPVGLLPASTQARRALLDLYVLEKATYELQYECDNRPDWVVIPLRGLLALAAA